MTIAHSVKRFFRPLCGALQKEQPSAGGQPGPADAGGQPGGRVNLGAEEQAGCIPCVEDHEDHRPAAGDRSVLLDHSVLLADVLADVTAIREGLTRLATDMSDLQEAHAALCFRHCALEKSHERLLVRRATSRAAAAGAPITSGRLTSSPVSSFPLDCLD